MEAKAWLLKLALLLGIFLAPIRASMAAVCLLVVADLFTGIWAAHHRGEKISSWGLRKTVSKVLAYELAVVLAYTVEQSGVSFLPLVKAIAGFILMTELQSATENLGRITGLDLWQTVRGYIQGNKLNPEKKDVEDAGRISDQGPRGPQT